jgi:hypothetical protein
VHVGIDLFFQRGETVGSPQQKVSDPIGRPPLIRFTEVIEVNGHIELQLRVSGGIGDDGGDPVIFLIPYPEDLADGVSRAEIFLSCGGRENDIVVVFEGGGIAFLQGEGEDPEEGRVCVEETVLAKMGDDHC